MFPPDPQAFFETIWRGQKQRLALALQEKVLYFWEVDSPHFQCAPEEWVFAVNYQLCFGDERQITPQLLANELEWALAHNLVGRRFQLADTTPQLLADQSDWELANRRAGRRIQLTDTLTVFLREGYNESTVVFRLGEVEKWGEFCGNESESMKLPIAVYIEQLENEALNDPLGHDLFSDALANQEIPFVFRSCASICLSKGTEAEMERISDLIFMLSPEWVRRVLSVYKCEGFAGGIVVLALGKEARYMCGGYLKDYGFFSLSHPYAELWDIWLQYFGPQINLATHHAEIQAGYRVFFWNCRPKPHNEYLDWERNLLHEKTQHEKLELVLQLRDWLRDDVGLADERIAELLA